MRKSISLTGIKSLNELETLAKCFPSFGFELSYDLSKERLEEALSLIQGRVSSLHALSPKREFFPNFGSSGEEDIAWSKGALLEDAKLASTLGASIIVLHPGYMADALIPRSPARRLAYFESEVYKPFIAYAEGSICTEEYISSAPYRKAFSLMKKNLIELSKEIEEIGVTLAVENLNPRGGYLLIHPREMLELASEGLHLTLDIGHLWITSELFGLDFFKEIERIMETKMVSNVHLHTNPSSKRERVFVDSHSSLLERPALSEKALCILSNYDTNLTIETLSGTEESASLLNAL